MYHAGETHEAIRHKAPTWGGWVLDTNTLSCCVCQHFANFKSVHSKGKCQIETETNLDVHIFRILLKSGQNRRSTLLKALKLGKESEKEEKHSTDSSPATNLQPFISWFGWFISVGNSLEQHSGDIIVTNAFFRPPQQFRDEGKKRSWRRVRQEAENDRI